MNDELGIRNYVESHSFLKEQAKLYQSIDNAVSFIEPIEFPTIDECKELVKGGLPLLQHEDIQSRVTEAMNKLAPQVIQSLDIEINEALERLIKWAIIDRLIPKELKS
ncbi:MAG: hypothetical protein IJ563_01015, partial [Selenomonadaceae bacterium]|nr:hypothetical protein [Selenomonadaceae bacterium]